MSDPDPAAQVAADTPRHSRFSTLLFTVSFLAALSLLVAMGLRSLPVGYFRDGEGHPELWVFVAVPVLLLLLSFFRVNPARGKRLSLAVSTLSLSASALTTLGLCVAFGILLAPADKPSEILIYILGLAALIIGGQHLVEFHEAQRMLDGVNTQLDETTRKLSKATLDIEGRVASLTETLGYAQYRDMVNRAYAQARTRVRACTNHWPIDPTFWSEELSNTTDLANLAFWEGQDVYRNLRQAVRATRVDPEPLQMVFVGRFSLSLAARAPALSEREFTLFVGILWRLAVAHRLRAEMRDAAANDHYRRESSVRVMVADVPINCHVINEDAFLLLHLPSDGGAQSYGLKLTTPGGPSTPDQPGPSRPSVADTYAEIIDRYTRTHVHSAREYVASLLVMAATAIADYPFEEVVLMRETTPNRPIVVMLLDALGMQGWLNRQCGPHRDILTTRDVKLDREDWSAGATLLLEDFLSHYYAPGRVFKLPERRPGGLDWYQGVLTMEDLVGDLL